MQRRYTELGCDPAMPSQADLDTMMALAENFATAMLTEGRKLHSPHPGQVSAMFVFYAAAKALLSLGLPPKRIVAGMEQVVILEQNERAKLDVFKAVLAAKAGDR